MQTKALHSRYFQASLALVVLAIALFFGLPGSFSFGEVPIYQVDVVNEYPHDSNAFTQGLAFVDGKLYEGTGQRGSRLCACLIWRRVNYYKGKI